MIKTLAEYEFGREDEREIYQHLSKAGYVLPAVEDLVARTKRDITKQIREGEEPKVVAEMSISESNGWAVIRTGYSDLIRLLDSYIETLPKAKIPENRPSLLKQMMAFTNCEPEH